MSNPIADLIRQCFTAYETSDRELIEAALAPDFTFSSPVDDNISREAYFERCWPNSAHIEKFELQPILVDGDQAIARYHGTATDGSRFHNVEVFTIASGKVRHVDVYFGSDTAESVDHSEIKATLCAWAAAIGRKDVAATDGYFADNAVNFFIAPPLVADEPLEKNLRGWFATFEGPLSHTLHQLHITGGGSCACAHGLIHLTGTRTDGTAADIWYRLTLALTKTDRAWKIVHAHESVPFLMDGSEKAATHLTP
ncbi:MAG: nuclear transport factor 2 family protein [Luteolibacter sp.]